MKVKTATRLIRDELSRRTGFAVNDLGYGKLRILSPRPLELRVLSAPKAPGRPVERAAEELLRRAGELGWHPTLR